MTDASKRGKRAKRTGRYSEKALEKLLLSWGLPARRIPLSGSLKIQGLDSDLRVELKGTEYKVENKKRQTFGRYYKITAKNKAIIVGESFVMLSQEAFRLLVGGYRVEEENIKDKKFKFIHDCFAQDNADITTLTSNYKPYIFCLTIELYKELIKGCV